MSKFTDLAPRIMRDLMAEPQFGFGIASWGGPVE